MDGGKPLLDWPSLSLIFFCVHIFISFSCHDLNFICVFMFIFLFIQFIMYQLATSYCVICSSVAFYLVLLMLLSLAVTLTLSLVVALSCQTNGQDRVTPLQSLVTLQRDKCAYLSSWAWVQCNELRCFVC